MTDPVRIMLDPANLKAWIVHLPDGGTIVTDYRKALDDAEDRDRDLLQQIAALTEERVRVEERARAAALHATSRIVANWSDAEIRRAMADGGFDVEVTP